MHGTIWDCFGVRWHPWRRGKEASEEVQALEGIWVAPLRCYCLIEIVQGAEGSDDDRAKGTCP